MPETPLRRAIRRLVQGVWNHEIPVEEVTGVLTSELERWRGPKAPEPTITLEEGL